MTRKYIESLYLTMRGCRPSAEQEAMLVQWNRDCLAIAGAIFSHNPSFDVARFIRDCQTVERSAA